MGQYYKGTKIGTCECMYYMRLATAQEMALQGLKDDDGIKFSDYLSDNQTKFRFPFPDEDNINWPFPGVREHDKSFSLPAGGIEIDHDRICQHIKKKNAGSGFNIFFPCPYSEKFKDTGIETSQGGQGEQWIEVQMEGIRDGKLKTIFTCSLCGNMFRLSDEDIEKLKARAKEYFKVYDQTGKNQPNENYQRQYDYAMKVIERIH